MFGLSISFHEMAAGSLGVLTKKTKSLLLRIRNAGAFSISAIVPLPPLSASAFKARHVPRKTVGARPKETGPSESRRSVAVVVQLFRADGLAATRRSLRARVGAALSGARVSHPMLVGESSVLEASWRAPSISCSGSKCFGCCGSGTGLAGGRARGRGPCVPSDGHMVAFPQAPWLMVVEGALPYWLGNP